MLQVKRRFFRVIPSFRKWFLLKCRRLGITTNTQTRGESRQKKARVRTFLDRLNLKENVIYYLQCVSISRLFLILSRFVLHFNGFYALLCRYNHRCKPFSQKSSLMMETIKFPEAWNNSTESSLNYYISNDPSLIII